MFLFDKILPLDTNQQVLITSFAEMLRLHLLIGLDKNVSKKLQDSEIFKNFSKLNHIYSIYLYEFTNTHQYLAHTLILLKCSSISVCIK